MPLLNVEFSDVTIMIIGDSLPESESHSLDLDTVAKDGGGGEP